MDSSKYYSGHSGRGQTQFCNSHYGGTIVITVVASPGNWVFFEYPCVDDSHHDSRLREHQCSFDGVVIFVFVFLCLYLYSTGAGARMTIGSMPLAVTMGGAGAYFI